MFWAKNIKIVISLQRMKPEKSFCTLSSLEMASFDDIWVYFEIAIEQKVQKRKKSKIPIALFFEKIAQNQQKKILVT